MLLTSKMLLQSEDMLSNAISQVEKIEDEQSRKDAKNTDRLVKAVKGLTDQLIKTEKDGKKNSSRLTIGGLLGSAKDTVKSYTSVSGIAGKIADSGANPIVRALAGSVANNLDSKQEEKQKQENFVSSVMTGTEFGRSFGADKKSGVRAAAKIYAERTSKEQQLNSLRAKQELIQQKGKESGVETNLSKEELNRITEIESYIKLINEQLSKLSTDLNLSKLINEQLSKLSTDLNLSKLINEQLSKLSNQLTPLLDDDREELMTGVREGILAELDSLLSEEKETLQKADPNYVNAAIEGALAELNGISKEQLTKLIAIQNSLEKSEEDMLENRIEKDAEPKIEKKEEKKEEGFFLKLLDFGKGLFLNPLKSLSGLLSSVPRLLMLAIAPIGSMLGGLLSSAATVLGPVAAVVGAGYAGFKVGEKINSLVEENTGGSIGTHIYDGVQWMKKAVGLETDEDKIKEADVASRDEISKHKAKMGRKLVSDSATQLRRIDNDIETQEAKLKKAEAVNIVNAPQTVNNNNTTKNIIVPKIRNDEVTYMRQIDRRLSY